jgi:DNA-binding transcriptional ArsR family regulator
MKPASHPVNIHHALAALSAPTRLEILRQLSSHGPLSVNEIVIVVQEPQPTVSKHLNLLRMAGLVSYEKSGVVHHYALTRAALTTVALHLSEIATEVQS